MIPRDPMTTPATALRNPGVHFPPPLVYVTGFLIGWLIDRRWPAPLSQLSGETRDVIALLCLALWLALMSGAFIVFTRAHTSIIPNRPASAIVRSGPYRFTRNPMYVSLAALYAGLALLYDSWWPLLFLIPVLLVIRYAVIAREEKYLTGAFPVEYSAYCSHVRRWL